MIPTARYLTTSRFGTEYNKIIKFSTSETRNAASGLEYLLPKFQEYSAAIIDVLDAGSCIDPRIGPSSFVDFSISANKRSKLIAAEEAIAYMICPIASQGAVYTLDNTYVLKLPGHWRQWITGPDIIRWEKDLGARIYLYKDAPGADNEDPSPSTEVSNSVYCEITADSEWKIESVLCVIEDILIAHKVF